MKMIKIIAFMVFCLCGSTHISPAAAGGDVAAEFARREQERERKFKRQQMSGSSSGDSQLSLSGSESSGEESKSFWDEIGTPRAQLYLNAPVTPEEIEQHKRTISTQSERVRLRRIRALQKITYQTKKQKRDARKEREKRFRQARINRKRTARREKKEVQSSSKALVRDMPA